MGAALGLLAGAGLVLIYLSFGGRPTATRRRLNPQTRAALLKTSLTFGGVWLMMLVVSQNLPVATVLAGAVAAIPWSRRNSAQRKQQLLERDSWPDIVDDLASGVRAGLPLTEALVSAGERAPDHMRPAFAHFASKLRLTGRVDEALVDLETELASPVATRVIDAVRMTRDVGGVDIGRVLRTLSAYLREDARLRGEIEARQSWSINAARMAVAAPWLVLAMLSLRPTAVAAYRTSTGIAILLLVAVTSVIAYRLMRLLGRLPNTSEFA
jgi:tight adherence protein B